MSTEIAKTEAIGGIELIANNAPAVLMENQAQRDRCVAAGQKLIEAGQTEMNEFNKDQLLLFVSRARKTIKALNERRKPYTQALDLIKKEFTSIESSITPLVEQAQKMCDSYVAELMKKKQEEERKAQIKLAEEKERIAIRQSAEVSYNNAFIDFLSDEKQKHLKWFSDLLLDQIDKAESQINLISTSFNEVLKRPLYAPSFVSPDEVVSIYDEVLQSLQGKFQVEYEKEIQLLKRELIDKLPSKKKELETLALADAAESERIIAEKKKREAEEAERLKAEEAKKKAEAESAAAVNATGAQAAAMVDAQATLFDAPKVVESYEIVLSNIAGYLILMQFWFEKEGKNLTFEKIEKMTFARAKVFCENWAKKNEEFVTSPVIRYEPKYKAK